MHKLDILHIISGDLWAGAEVQVFHTLTHLKAQKGASVGVVLFNKGVLNRRLSDCGVEVIVIDESRHNGLTMLFHLTKLICRLKPAIIHVHAFKEHILGQTAGILCGNKSALLRTFHGLSEVPEGLSLFKYIQSSIIHLLERAYLNFRTGINIIAVSRDLENFLKGSYPRASVTQIYNGIPCAGNNPGIKEDIRRQFEVDDNTFWVGTAARLAEPKNLDMLIDAGNELRSHGIDFRISIFGDGPLREKLQDRIDNLNLYGCVRLEGFREEIMPILASLDAFVLCSLHEGLPMSLIETMSTGTPVVCTDVGGIKEVITNNTSGLLIPSNDVKALAAAIMKLKQDASLRERLAFNAKQRVDEDFSIDSTNNKLINLYNALLRNN